VWKKASKDFPQRGLVLDLVANRARLAAEDHVLPSA
jgi:hypothetical protein